MDKFASNDLSDWNSRLREERERLGLNQSDFAEKAGKGLVSQSRYEAGARQPDVSYLIKIARAGADVLYILTGRRESAEPVYTDQECLIRAIAVVERGLEEAGKVYEAEEKAELIGAAYEILKKAGPSVSREEEDNVIRLIRAA